MTRSYACSCILSLFICADTCLQHAAVTSVNRPVMHKPSVCFFRNTSTCQRHAFAGRQLNQSLLHKAVEPRWRCGRWLGRVQRQTKGLKSPRVTVVDLETVGQVRWPCAPQTRPGSDGSQRGITQH